MNSKLRIMCCLTIVGVGFLLLNGCGEKTESPKDVVSAELDYLVDSKTQSVKQREALSQIVPSDEKNEQTDEEIAQTFDLFFENFAYEITASEIVDDKAKVNVNLTTIDATALAKDFIAQSTVKQIQGTTTPINVTFSSSDYYHSLYTLLSAKNYPTVESECTITLTKTDDVWQIDSGQNLDSKLTGDFAAAVANPNLFTPEEIATVYLNTIKAFDKEQMSQFLSIDTLFSTDDTYKRTVSHALAEQILKHFNYNIIDSKINGNEASVDADITSYDANSIIQNLSAQMASYTSTAQALADGESGRASKAKTALLDCINKNTDAATSKVTLNLTNDGASWKLKMDETLSQAILGNVIEATASTSE